jgi:ankyrin repeat protein
MSSFFSPDFLYRLKKIQRFREKTTKIVTNHYSNLNNNGWNELFHACYSGDYQLLPILIDKYKYKLNNLDKSKRSAIFYTVALDENCMFDKIDKKLDNKEYLKNKIKCFLLLIKQIDILKCLGKTKVLNLYYIALKFISIIHKKYQNINININTNDILNALIENDRLNIIYTINETQQTPLINACENEDEKTVNFLLDKGANIIIVNNGFSLFYIAFTGTNDNIAVKIYDEIEKKKKNESTKIYYEMFINYIKTGRKTFYIPCQNKLENFSIKLFNEIINPSLDIKDKLNILNEDYNGQTPLIVACLNNMEVIAKKLIEYPGINIMQRSNKDTYFYTALSAACENGMEDIVNLLIKKIESGPYTEVEKNSQWFNENTKELIKNVNQTPLSYACLSNMNNEIIEKLLSKVKYSSLNISYDINRDIKYLQIISDVIITKKINKNINNLLNKNINKDKKYIIHNSLDRIYKTVNFNTNEFLKLFSDNQKKDIQTFITIVKQDRIIVLLTKRISELNQLLNLYNFIIKTNKLLSLIFYKEDNICDQNSEDNSLISKYDSRVNTLYNTLYELDEDFKKKYIFYENSSILENLYTSFLYACKRNKLIIVNYFLEINVSIRPKYFIYSNEKNSLLKYACINNMKDIIEVLLLKIKYNTIYDNENYINELEFIINTLKRRNNKTNQNKINQNKINQNKIIELLNNIKVKIQNEIYSFNNFLQDLNIQIEETLKSLNQNKINNCNTMMNELSKKISKFNVSYNTPYNSNLYFPLLYACISNKVEMVSLLIHQKALCYKINENNMANTPIFYLFENNIDIYTNLLYYIDYEYLDINNCNKLLELLKNIYETKFEIVKKNIEKNMKNLKKNKSKNYSLTSLLSLLRHTSSTTNKSKNTYSSVEIDEFIRKIEVIPPKYKVIYYLLKHIDTLSEFINSYESKKKELLESLNGINRLVSSNNEINKNGINNKKNLFTKYNEVIKKLEKKLYYFDKNNIDQNTEYIRIAILYICKIKLEYTLKSLLENLKIHNITINLLSINIDLEYSNHSKYPNTPLAYACKNNMVNEVKIFLSNINFLNAEQHLKIAYLEQLQIIKNLLSKNTTNNIAIINVDKLTKNQQIIILLSSIIDGVFRKLQTRENPKDFSHPASPLSGQALQGSAEIQKIID